MARLGGDEFAMLLPDISDAEAATAAAHRVHKTLEEPFTAGGLALRVESSVGIALYPDHGEKAGTLMRAADVAMYAAKQGHSGHAIYSPEQQHYSPARLGLVAQLDRAMAQGELVLHYQPQGALRQRRRGGRRGPGALAAPRPRACCCPTSSYRSPSTPR